jgi:hypothetical protein
MKKVTQVPTEKDALHELAALVGRLLAERWIAQRRTRDRRSAKVTRKKRGGRPGSNN